MRKSLATIFVVFAFVCLVSAQQPKVAVSGISDRHSEVYGGFAYANTDFVGRDVENAKGFDAAYTYFPGSKFGLTIDGSYMKNSGQGELSQYSLMGGPRYNILDRKIVPFVHGLVGYNKIKLLPAPKTLEHSGFGLALGGGVDVRVSRSFAVRAVQADWLHSPFVTHSTDWLRLGFGAVYRF